MHAVLLRKPVYATVTMRLYASSDIAYYADIQRSVRFIRGDDSFSAFLGVLASAFEAELAPGLEDGDGHCIG